MGKKLREGLKEAAQEAKTLITKDGEEAPRLKPSDMRNALMVYLQRNQYDPVQSLIDLAMGKDYAIVDNPDIPKQKMRVPIDVDPSLRVSIHKEFLRYLAPAMKVSDPDKGVEAQFEVYINNFVLSHAGVPKQEALDNVTNTANDNTATISADSSGELVKQPAQEDTGDNDSSGATESGQLSVTISSFGKD